MRGSRKQKKTISKPQKHLKNEDIRKYMKNIETNFIQTQNQMNQEIVIAKQNESVTSEKGQVQNLTQFFNKYQSENKTQISYSNDKMGGNYLKNLKYQSKPKERQLLLTNQRLKLHIPVQKIHKFGIFDKIPEDLQKKFKAFNEFQVNESQNKIVVQKDRNRSKRRMKNLERDKNSIECHLKQEKLEKYKKDREPQSNTIIPSHFSV